MALQGSWPFNKGSGTVAADTSGNGRDATNVPGWTASGHTSSAMQINGSGQGAQVAIPADFSFYPTSTFMCWVRFNSLPASGTRQIINGPMYGGSWLWNLLITSAGVIRVVGSGTINGSTLTTGTWYHIAVAIDWAAGGGGSNAKLYVNGTQVGSGNGFPINDGTLYWGGNDQPFDGSIDDARWNNLQLNQTQIQTLMNTPVPGPLTSSGSKRFLLNSSGTWKPVRTERLVGVPQVSTKYGWQLTPQDAGLNRHGINGDNLPEYHGPSKPLNGAVIIGKKITTGLDLSNGNITIERCYVRPADTTGAILTTFDFNLVIPGGLATIRDCTIDGSGLTQQQSAFSLAIQATGTITGNLITSFGSGIALMGTGTTGNTVVQGNYVHNLTAWGDPATNGNHSDGFTVRDYTNSTEPARNATIVNNYIDCSSGNDTGACFIQTSAGNINNVSFDGNLFMGGGYNVGIGTLNGNTYSNIAFNNNRFTPTGWGPTSRGGGPGAASWVANYINDPGQANNQGAVVTAP